MATDLGKAYVQIMPSAKGISGSIQQAINPEATAAGKSAGKSIMSSIVDTIGGLGDTLTNKITKPALTAGAALTTMVGALGFRRLIGMDNAQAKLQGLGVEGKLLEQVMKDVEGAVTGTTHTMAEGADVAAGALAAGVKEGADLERYVTLVGDAATGANRSMDEMAMIFNRVQGSGKLMTMELNQIEHGMPGFSQALAKHLGVPVEEMRKMVTDGKVTSEEFLDVMEDFAGGMSDAFAGTWTGMAKNVLSNIGILGERMLGGLFEDGKKGMASFLEVLRSDDLRNWAEETGVAIREFILNVVDGIKQVKEWRDNLSPSVQDTIKKVALFGSIGEVAIGPILKTITKLVTVFTTVASVAGKVGAGIAAIANPIGLTITAITALTGAFLYFFNTNEEFRERVIGLWEGFKDTMINAWETFIGYITPAIEAVRDFIMEIWGGLVEWWQESGERIIEAGQNVWSFISTIIETAMDLIWSIMQFVWPFVELIIVQVWENIKGVIDGAIQVITGIIDAFASLLTGDWSGLWESIKKILSGAVQVLWNLVNLWFVGRIIGVARNFAGMLGNVVRGAWNTVRGLFSSGLSTVRNLASTGLNAVRNTFSNVMGGLRNVVSNSFNRVRSAVSNGMNRALNAVTNVAGRFKDAGRRIVTSIADGIKGAVGKVTGAIGNVASKIRGFLPFSPPKEGPLMDIMDVKWGETISGGIVKGESVVAEAMENLFSHQKNCKKARYSGGSGQTVHNENNITIHATIREEQDIEKLAKEINDYINQSSRSQGVVIA